MIKKILIITLLLIIPLIGGYYIFLFPNSSPDADTNLIKITKQHKIWDIADILQNNGFIKNKYTFLISSLGLNYHKYLKPGAYQIKPNSSNWRIIKMLKAGNQKPIYMVIYDVNNEVELTERICKYLEMSEIEVTSILDNQTFLNELGFNRNNILTMFIPNTYQVYWNIKPEVFFKKMRKEYDKFWNEERRSKAKKLKLDPIEVSILASIVQAETVKKHEAAKIAGVYINRLRKRIKLEACPTLKFATGNHKASRVLREYRNVDSQYNTYKNYGLPPGPINVPRPFFIDAVLNAEKHKFLYFCAKEDFSGEHFFSTNLNSHLNHARKYQHKLNKRKIYR